MPMRAKGDLRPLLPATLKEQLMLVAPSDLNDCNYFPCAVTLRDGSRLECVYLVEQYRYIRPWGVYPGDDSAKSEIGVDEILSIEESRSRLPARFANQLYAAGESGMGYVAFTIVFSDGSKQAYVTGNAVDFVDYPDGKTAQDVVKVLPHRGRDDSPRYGKKYLWCLYSDEETERSFQLGLTRPFPTERLSLLSRVMRFVRRSRNRRDR
jgi:hypothetical protein